MKIYDNRCGYKFSLNLERKNCFNDTERIVPTCCFCSQFSIEEADGLDITKQIIENEAGFKTAGCLYIKLNELFIISVSSALF